MAVAAPFFSAGVRHFNLGMFVAKRVESTLVVPERPFAIPAPASETGRAATALPQPAPRESVPAGVVEPAPLRIPWQVVLRYGWMAVTLVLLGRLLVTFLYGVHLVRHASRVRRDHVQQAVDNVKSRLAISWGLEVRTSRDIRSPLVWCWSRPSILLVPDPCYDSQLDWAGVVAHELAHCKRRDHATGLVAEVMASVLPWNPLMWLSRRFLIRLGEQACDDWVITTGQSCEDYAESLLHFRPQKQPAFWPAVVSSKSGLAHRVRRILSDACGNPRIGVRWAVTLGIAVMCVGIGLAFAQVRPTLAEASTKPEETSVLPLSQAAAAGDIEQVQKLLAQGADVNGKGKDGSTPLHEAAGNGWIAVVRLLLDKGANVKATDASGRTPLHRASSWGTRLTGEWLLAKGASVNATDNLGNTPLHYAAHEGKVDTARLLIAQGADVNAKLQGGGWWGGSTPLHLVAKKGNTAMVRLLISRGADVNAKDSWGHTPLSIAENVSDKDLFGQPRKTPLTDQVKAAKKEIAELLREHGAKE